MVNRPPNDFLKLLHRVIASGEEKMDAARRGVSRKLGTNPPRQIAAYHGYADPAAIHVSGRVLSNKPRGGPLDDDGWWENLVNTYRRWESDEVVGARVTLRFGEHEQSVVTDEEGYYRAKFPAISSKERQLVWSVVSARTEGEDGEIHGTHEIMVPPREASFGIISDLDDTVIRTGITSILLAAKLTFLENAKTRKPLEGVAELYDALQRGHVDTPHNPLFYISSSPWNLHDLLVDFLQLNEIPVGPLLLRDVGLDRTKFIKEKGHGHKLEKALGLMDAYPHLPFVLIGDSGQEDPAIYAEVTRLRPGRTKAIYIRDIDPDMETHLDESVARAMEIAAASGVPMLPARDSRAISEHARELGLIPGSALGKVSAEVEADKARPETGEQALKDAVESVLPEGAVDSPGK